MIGVDHREIATGPERGCAVTFVPESDGGPHMAKLSEDRYYQRTGGRFVQMEHYAIADMFGRRRRPALTVEARPRANGRIVVSILNEGRGTARGPYLKLLLPPPVTLAEFGVDGNGNEGLPRLPSSQPQEPQFAGTGVTLIHPQQRFEVTGLEHRRIPPGKYLINYHIAAEDYPLTAGTIELAL